MEYEIDFCFGGDRALAAAIKEQGIKEEEVMIKLNDAYDTFDKSAREERDWRTASLSELIDFIVNKHHIYKIKIDLL
ncbi:protein of unknown function [Natronincola peptidivorans]|uniref:Uncharacterized protein n=2 Tax=Natronincola peptidivorans TaxID=426128 RepID=A0A1I0G1V9_9FIRM|nr:protein of unknown function [Natronincola peptidivorans]